MKVLVTGATGLIGRALVETLLASGHEVTALVRGGRSLPGVTTLELDGLTQADILRAMEPAKDARYDAAINLAAAGVAPSDRDPERLVAVNAVFPSAFAAAARQSGAEVFLQVGSCSEYAPFASPIPETAPLERHALYGATKAAGGILVQSTGASIGLDVAVLRVFNVYGPGEKPHRLLPSLATRLARGETVALSDGLQVRDYLGVDEVCLRLALFLDAFRKDRGLAGEYNLGSGVPRTVADFARSVARVLGASEALLDFGALPRRPDDRPEVVAATDKLAAAIGQVPVADLEQHLGGMCRKEATAGT